MRPSDGSETPTVSVIVPCRNEEATIAGCLTSLLAGDYPHSRLEILVVDGQSTDGTRREIETVLEAYPGAPVSVVENAKQTTTPGLNVGLGASTGEVVALASAHATYPPEYLSRLVDGLRETGAECVGGALVTGRSSQGVVARAIAACLSHPFGVGNSLMRTKHPTEPAEVDAVAFGCWRRETLEALGGFDERMERSQDFDLNWRLRRGGGRVLLLPDVSATYVARGTLGQLMRHNVSNGFWVTYPRLTVGTRFSLRHYMPVAFVGALMAGALPWHTPRTLAILGAAAYGVATVAGAADVARREHSFVMGLASLAVFPCIHIPYGIGSVRGAFAAALKWRPARTRRTKSFQHFRP